MILSFPLADTESAFIFLLSLYNISPAKLVFVCDGTHKKYYLGARNI